VDARRVRRVARHPQARSLQPASIWPGKGHCANAMDGNGSSWPSRRCSLCRLGLHHEEPAGLSRPSNHQSLRQPDRPRSQRDAAVARRPRDALGSPAERRPGEAVPRRCQMVPSALPRRPSGTAGVGRHSVEKGDTAVQWVHGDPVLIDTLWCPRHARPARRGSGVRGSSGSVPDAIRSTWLVSSSPLPRRSATGACRPTRPKAGGRSRQWRPGLRLPWMRPAVKAWPGCGAGPSRCAWSAASCLERRPGSRARSVRRVLPRRTAQPSTGPCRPGLRVHERQPSRRPGCRRGPLAPVASAAPHARSREPYGAPRVHAGLRFGGAQHGRKHVANLMHAAGLGRQSAACRGDSHEAGQGRTACAGPLVPDRHGRGAKPGVGRRHDGRADHGRGPVSCSRPGRLAPQARRGASV